MCNGIPGPAKRFFKWGRGGGGGQCESVSVSKLGGPGACSPVENFKFKSSEMAINAYENCQ